MKVLFSPSEAKSDFTDSCALYSGSFMFPELLDKRLDVLNKLNTFLSNCDTDKLEKFFGIKNKTECLKLSKLDLTSSSTCKAIQRYIGTAYKYLEFGTLSTSQQDWILENTIIFSNLFGPILAKNKIPYYRFKQGSTMEEFKPEKFYKENFTDALDNFINDDLVIDLRAGFYEKFYTLTCRHISMKFIKNEKVVSHWAKAYRGIVLKELAKRQPNNIEEFEMINFDALHVKEIIDKKLKREYVFEIE